MVQQPGEHGGDDRAQADEESLHGETARALLGRQEAGDEGAEGLHADVDGGIHHPEQACRHPQRRRVGHGDECAVQCGTSDDVHRVIVDGRTVVENGHVRGVDEAQVLADAQREAERLWAEVPEWHWQQLTADQLSPPSFPPLTADLGG